MWKNKKTVSSTFPTTIFGIGTLLALKESARCDDASMKYNAKTKQKHSTDFLHLSDLPDTKVRIFYPMLVESWYQFLYRILGYFCGMSGLFWHYQLEDAVNDFKVDGLRFKYTGDPMELLLLQLYENALTVVTFGFRRFLGYTSRNYGRYIDEHIEIVKAR